MHRYIAALFLLTAAGSASAQQLSMSNRIALRDNCKEDIQRLCAGIQPGGGQLLSCVQEKKSQLSKACSETLTALQAKRKN